MQIDRYVSLRQNGPSNYTSYWSSKRLVATSLGPVFELFQNPGNHNWTDHQRAWTATAVQLQPMVSPVWLPVFWKVLDRTLEHYYHLQRHIVCIRLLLGRAQLIYHTCRLLGALALDGTTMSLSYIRNREMDIPAVDLPSTMISAR